MANNQINNEYVQKGYLKTYLANRGIKVISYDEWEHLCDCIDDAKAADVRENVRGEWIKGGEQPYFRKHFDIVVCSICNKRGEKRWKFCPNCGADMRGDKDG